MALIPSFFGGRRGNIFDPFSLDIWDPYTSEAPARETTSGSGVITPRIDWKETPEVHIIKAELPGVQKSEVRVEVEEGRVLQISGDFRQEKEDKNDKWHRVERVRGKFLRRFRLPEDAMMDQIKASMDNGVLTVVVPKAQEKKLEVKNIDISGA